MAITVVSKCVSHNMYPKYLQNLLYAKDFENYLEEISGQTGGNIFDSCKIVLPLTCMVF